SNAENHRFYSAACCVRTTHPVACHHPSLPGQTAGFPGALCMKLRSILAAFSIVLGSTFAAMANGAWSEFPAGGVVVFKPDKNIRIAREDLEIGWKLIRVRYVFVSDASEPVE